MGNVQIKPEKGKFQVIRRCKECNKDFSTYSSAQNGGSVKCTNCGGYKTSRIRSKLIK